MAAPKVPKCARGRGKPIPGGTSSQVDRPCMKRASISSANQEHDEGSLAYLEQILLRMAKPTREGEWGYNGSSYG